jgi:hypothetical protein
MWSSPIQRITSATKRSSHSDEIQQLRLKYSVADMVSSGNSFAPASSRCSSMRCSHDGSQPHPASMYAVRSCGNRSYTPWVIIESSAFWASWLWTVVCHSVKVSKRSEPSLGALRPMNSWVANAQSRSWRSS